MPNNRESLEARFWRKVNKTDNCWLWIGATTGDGYGKINNHGKRLFAHVAAWEICYGKIPNGMRVGRACENRLCVNPGHLHLVDIQFESRFWRNVDKTGECWIWTGSKVWSGYGKINKRGKRLRSHRVSWELHFGKIPDEMQVLHDCDNPICVNPSHLHLGTHADNMREASERGRARGRRGVGSKLNAEDVKIIIAEYAKGDVGICVELAGRFDVSASHISAIGRGNAWKSIAVARRGTKLNNRGGEHCKNAKLTNGNVKEIRRLISSGQCTRSSLANRFGVTVTTITNAYNGKTWADS